MQPMDHIPFILLLVYSLWVTIRRTMWYFPIQPFLRRLFIIHYSVHCHLL